MGDTFKYELLDLSNTHNAIADWLIANPGKGQIGRCAAHFGYTRSWLSTLIHQDAFQAMLKHKQGETYQAVIIPLHEKLAGVAHRGVERLGEVLESTTDERLVREITRDSLQALGYGASARGPAVHIDQSTHNTLNVDSAALAAARERRSQHYRSTALESPSQPPEPSPRAAPAELSHHQEAPMGETRDVRAEHVNGEAPVYRDPKTWGEV
jgi:hypothetical protein